MDSEPDGDLRSAAPAGKRLPAALRAAIPFAFVILVAGSLLAYPYVRAEMFFASQSRRLQAPRTIDEARRVATEEGAAIRVLPSGEWLIGDVVNMHERGFYDAAILCASDGTVFTSVDHFCCGTGELYEFLDSLEGDTLEKIGPAIERNGYYEFAIR